MQKEKLSSTAPHHLQFILPSNFNNPKVLSAGKERAQTLVNSYARLDLLRPYFDVEPADIRSRLIASLWPQFSRQPQVGCVAVVPSRGGGIGLLAFSLRPLQISHDIFSCHKPYFFSQMLQVISSDLYGPIMLALTLAAVLLMGMKTTGRVAPVCFFAVESHLAYF
jgi:hypothetical protein